MKGHMKRKKGKLCNRPQENEKALYVDMEEGKCSLLDTQERNSLPNGRKEKAQQQGLRKWKEHALRSGTEPRRGRMPSRQLLTLNKLTEKKTLKATLNTAFPAWQRTT